MPRGDDAQLDALVCYALLDGPYRIYERRVNLVAQPAEAVEGCRQGCHAQQRGESGRDKHRLAQTPPALWGCSALGLEFFRHCLAELCHVRRLSLREAGRVHAGQEFGYVIIHVSSPPSAPPAGVPGRGGDGS